MATYEEWKELGEKFVELCDSTCCTDCPLYELTGCQDIPDQIDEGIEIAKSGSRQQKIVDENTISEGNNE